MVSSSFSLHFCAHHADYLCHLTTQNSPLCIRVLVRGQYHGSITAILNHLAAIPTEEDGGNHTPAFTDAAASELAHEACLDVSKALAATALRVVLDEEFYRGVSNQGPVIICLCTTKPDIRRCSGDFCL